MTSIALLRSFPRSLATISAAFLAGLTVGAASCSAPPPPPQESIPEGIGEVTLEDDLVEIAALEDARSDGGGRLQGYLASGPKRTRLRAAVALGRLPCPAWGASVTDALCIALDDPDPTLRRTAAFALGLRADPASEQDLLDAVGDPDPKVRRRVVEAMGKIDSPRLHEEVLYALRDPDAGVRAAAATATHRWPVDPAAGTDVVDTALANVVQQSDPPEVDLVVWRALFSLQRRGSERARHAYLTGLMRRSSPEARIFSALGLGELEGTGRHEPSISLLRQATQDEDWRVVYEAVRALGKHPNEEGAASIVAVARHDSVHVRTAVIWAIGQFPLVPNDAQLVLDRSQEDTSPSVRAAGLVAFATLRKGAANERILRESRSPEPLMRAAAARGATHMEAYRALPVLSELARDKDRHVAWTAALELGEVGNTQALVELLTHPDNGQRLAAVLGLARSPDVGSTVPALTTAFESSRGDISAELRFNILEAVGEVETPEARALLERGLTDPNRFVRETARRLLGMPHEAAPVGQAATDTERPPVLDADPGDDDANPVVEISTAKGVMIFELYPGDAPVHVYNFLALAQADHYDGLAFHRVVPDFVIQGGDYRGDGNGATTWRKEPLRHEFNPREYGRGALGMPRNDDPESGGSQIFVTHRPTPHLEGRYTLFGQLLHGFDTLDAIEVGDVILDVRARK